MNLTMSFIFAVLLVLIGAPRSLLHDNTDKIVAECGRYKHIGVCRSAGKLER